MNGYMQATDVARRAGVDLSAVSKAVREGMIGGTKDASGFVWVPNEDAEWYISKPRPPKENRKGGPRRETVTHRVKRTVETTRMVEKDDWQDRPIRADRERLQIHVEVTDPFTRLFLEKRRQATGVPLTTYVLGLIETDVARRMEELVGGR